MTPFTESQWELLTTIGERLVPPLGKLSQEEQGRFRRLIADALAERPSAVQRQFRLFLAVLRWAPLVRWGRPFHRLKGAQQDRFLRWLQDDAPGRLRQGMWGLKTIVYMGYYGQSELGPRFGYTPVREGNEKLHA